LIEKGFELPAYTADQAAEILTNESQSHDVILYEYFLTDFAGHARDINKAIKEIYKVEDLIQSTVKKTNFNKTTIIVISDHGNIEDIRTKSHTNNPAFFAVWWAKSVKQKPNLNSLQDIYPLVLALLQNNPA